MTRTRRPPNGQLGSVRAVYGDGTERIVTFVVRVIASPAGIHAVVERVKTGRKERVETIEAVGRVIAAMALASEVEP
jgi:hypothetical protein